MAAGLSKGDRVAWSSGRRHARGRIERVITSRAKVGGRTVVGSKRDPRYLARDEETGATAVRKGASLKPVRARRAQVPALNLPRPRRPQLSRPRLSRPRMPRLSARLATGAVAVLALAAGAAYYFTQVPGNAADDYDTRAGQAFEKVDESVYEAFQSFRARYFRGLVVKDLQEKRLDEDLAALRRFYRRQYASDRAAVKHAEGEVAAAEQAIDEAEADLTEVDAPPLLGGIGDLGDADETADHAADYLTSAREFMPIYRELLAYSGKTIELEEEITNAILDEAPGPGASLPTVRSSLNATLSRLRRAERKFKALGDAPESAAAFRFATDEGLALSLAYFEKLDRAIDQLDIGLIDEANEEIDEDVRQFGIGLFTRFADLQTEGEISDAIDEIEDAEDGLSEELGVDEGPASVVPPLLPPDGKDSKQQV